MAIKICDHCQQRYSVNPQVSDFVHRCSSGDVDLDFDDILILGSYNDFGGGGDPSSKSVMFGKVSNDLFGTRAGIDGGDDFTRTNKGRNESMFRQRRHFAYKEFKHDG